MITCRRFGTQTYALTSSGFSRILFALCSSRSGASIPGMHWEAAERSWVGYADAVGIVIKLARENNEQVNGDVDAPTPTTLLRVPALKGLYEYQQEAVRFLLAHASEGAVLGLDMGLGKTASVLRVARALKGEKAVAICPAFIASIWERECAKWWPEAHPAIVLRGTHADDKILQSKPRLIVCNYSILHAWADCIVQHGYRVMFLDEAHMLQGKSSRRVEAVRKIRQNAIACVALTGTPMPNRTRDLWLLGDILSPGRFGKFFDFGRRYCDGHQEQVTPDKAVWKFDGATHVEELNERLKHFMFRRTKKQVAAELPQRTRQIIELDVKRASASASMSLLIQNGKVNQKALRAQLDAAADRKLPQIAEHIATFLEGGHTVVCFTYRRVVAEALIDLLKAAGVEGDLRYVHGGLTQKKRLENIDAHPRVLTATIDSTGVGVDLSYADVGGFAELTYEPHEFAQAESRLHRRGQRRNVLIPYWIARGSADELIRDAVITKMINIENVVGSADDELLTDMRGGVRTTEEVLDDLAERLLKGAAE